MEQSVRGNAVAFVMEKYILDYQMALPVFIKKKKYKIISLLCY